MSFMEPPKPRAVELPERPQPMNQPIGQPSGGRPKRKAMPTFIGTAEGGSPVPQGNPFTLGQKTLIGQ